MSLARPPAAEPVPHHRGGLGDKRRGRIQAGRAQGQRCKYEVQQTASLAKFYIPVNSMVNLHVFLQLSFLLLCILGSVDEDYLKTSSKMHDQNDPPGGTQSGVDGVRAVGPPRPPAPWTCGKGSQCGGGSV